MGHAAHLNVNLVALHAGNGQMFFASGVGGVGNKLVHFFAAAQDRYAGSMQDTNQVAAVMANKESVHRKTLLFKVMADGQAVCH